jgi:hypothetical protein
LDNDPWCRAIFAPSYKGKWTAVDHSKERASRGKSPFFIQRRLLTPHPILAAKTALANRASVYSERAMTNRREFVCFTYWNLFGSLETRFTLVAERSHSADNPQILCDYRAYVLSEESAGESSRWSTALGKRSTSPRLLETRTDAAGLNSHRARPGGRLRADREDASCEGGEGGTRAKAEHVALAAS